jgi:hypothetical protein
MEKLELTPDELLLDLENPRLGSVETQASALQAIIDLDHKHFRTMMESIRDHGLDPGDSFYVILSEEESDYIVVDGNRRLAALRVLREPDLLQATSISPVLSKRLRTIANSFDRSSIETIECALFDDRPSANEWILRRHGRGLEGEERIHWGTMEIQRFQNDRTILDIMDFMARNASVSPDKWELINERVLKKTSVLRRFIESKPVRQLLGLTVVDDGEQRVPEFKLPPKQTVNVLEQIFSDIADGDIDTRTHNLKQDIADYVTDLVETRKITAKTGDSQRFRDVTIGAKSSTTVREKESQTKSETRKTRVRPPRVHLGPKTMGFAQPPSAKGQRLFHEASKLRLSDTPLASAYLLRAVLEHTFQVHMSANDIPRVDPKNGQTYDLKKCAVLVIDHLVSSKTATKHELHGIQRILTNSTDPASIQALNDYHHDKFLIPSGENLRAAWDAAEALFAAVYGNPS